MHYIYLDEAGCTLRAFNDPDQPIFVMGGLAVGDKKWNLTLTDFENVLNGYFSGTIPEGFELHTHQLLSPDGDGPFQNHDRAMRNQLALDLLNLVSDRGLYTFVQGIDKNMIEEAVIDEIRQKDHIELRTPYLLSFDNAITLAQQFVKSRSRTARGMFIIDSKPPLRQNIEEITRHRRFHPTRIKRVKRIVEFTNPIDSHKNPMIQLADLISYVSKKFLGIENGYHENYPRAAKLFFRDAYTIIDSRLYRKTFLPETGRYSPAFNSFMKAVQSRPSRGWKTKEYN